MKINLIYNSFPTPSETFLFNLAVELKKRDHDVSMVILQDTDNEKHYKDRINDFKVSIKRSPGTNPFRLMFFILNRFNKYLKFISVSNFNSFKDSVSAFVKLELIGGNQPDIIHFAYTGTAIGFINVMDLIPDNIKKIVSARGTSEIYKPLVDDKRSILLRSLWSKIDAVHCVSIDMVNRLEQLGLNRDKCFVNYPSIDTDKFCFTSRSPEMVTSVNTKLIIVSTGRLCFQKGYLFALLAIKNLISKGISLEYHILGEGPDRDLLKFVISDLSISRSVILHGKVKSNEVKALLQKAHIYLLPSIYEGVSNAVLEAMASGVPVITTCAGGMAEVIKNNYNGYLITRYDQNIISEIIEKIIHNYDEAINMSLHARETIINKFNLNNQIDIFENEYSRK
jgi:colanic acid/amylovoran biosynthesis glycosyltransferase